MREFLLLTPCFFLLSSCQSLQSYSSAAHWLTVVPSLNTASTTPGVEDELSEDLVPEENDTLTADSPIEPAETEAPIDLEEGFCRDDIVGRHLTAKYIKEIKGLDGIPSKGSRHKRARANRLQLEALHYARTVIHGPLPAYYGALPVVNAPEVEFWMRYFKTSGRQTFLKWLVRAERVRHIVEPVLAEEGLPLELFFLAMVESGFNNAAYSRARATGTWQFMHGTGKSYGLAIDHWVDERRDPVKSTRAAATFLRDLYAEFGDWYLAMAAYNAGPGKVRSAIRRAKSRSFWDLARTPYLRSETKHYVPKVLAALLVAKGLSAHGFNLASDPMDLFPESNVIVRKPVRLTELAQKLGVSVHDLKRWNPELIRDVVPPSTRSGGYRLRIPNEYAEKFLAIETALSYLEIQEYRMYQIRSGDTLSGISKRFAVPVRRILAVNPTLSPRRLRIGKSIAIPIPTVVAAGQDQGLTQPQGS